ncbi:WG repeat-containing protein [Microvirga sp. STR05]|uniref:WG repeat-containing protein n=1 Tax=Hymenobacter duratus TaxID=2771356 RepID=A0ABR8JBL5_9BACT|nr:WG repeat-containing protein [Hymenobacter duratus]MBD2714111.1 WG repeat-containing protein [Hymenobacter duratus]MBR7949013.1 WG repeat-containing protein [Microvirga sp. STR05]
MLHTYQAAPFSDSFRQQQFDALQAALLAETTAPATLLLGNLSLSGADSETLDAVLIRPHSIVLLLLVAGGGPLHMPDFGYGAWRLNNQPLTGSGGADNPFQQFSRQKEALAAWLRPQLPPEAANLNFISGLVLFEAPVVLGPEVEQRMSSVPASSSFHLLPDPARCTRRLRQLSTPEIDLTPADIAQLAQELASAQPHAGLEPPTGQAASFAAAPASAATAPSEEASQIRRAAGWFWRWLGAEDIAHDEPDQLPADTYATAPQQQKEELERIRASMQAELGEQLRALETREKEREQSIAQLREQLAAAPPVTPEAQNLQARLATENREKERLEAAMQASRNDLEDRNRALDSRIRQLEALMLQLQQPSSAQAPQTGTRNWRQAKQYLRQWRRYRARAAIGGAGVLAALLLWWGVRTVTAGPPVPFQEQGKWGYLTAHGDTLVPARYTAAESFQEDGRAIVEHEGSFGFIDEEGREVVPPAYDALQPYAEGYARARVGKLYTFLNEDGQESSFYYYNALPFSAGKAAVLDRRGWFYITNPNEQPENPVIFQEAYPFRNGLARVKRNGQYTFITEEYLQDPASGTEPFAQYSNAADFMDGRARVTQQGRTFFIDTDADEVK